MNNYRVASQSGLSRKVSLSASLLMSPAGPQRSCSAASAPCGCARLHSMRYEHMKPGPRMVPQPRQTPWLQVGALPHPEKPLHLLQAALLDDPASLEQIFLSSFDIKPVKRSRWPSRHLWAASTEIKAYEAIAVALSTSLGHVI